MEEALLQRKLGVRPQFVACAASQQVCKVGQRRRMREVQSAGRNPPYEISGRLTRRTRILHDRAEQLPAFAVELHHLHLLVDAVVVRPGVDLDAG